jgi:hypothetical protein
VLTYQRSPYTIDTNDYKSEMMTSLSQAWKLAQENIKIAQKHQKTHYDKKTRETHLKVGDWVMVLMPSEAKGEKRKLARPFRGPFRVLTVTPTNAEVRLVDDPKAAPIFVALDRVRICYPEQTDVTWTGRSKRRMVTPSKKPNSAHPAHRMSVLGRSPDP